MADGSMPVEVINPVTGQSTTISVDVTEDGLVNIPMPAPGAGGIWLDPHRHVDSLQLAIDVQAERARRRQRR